jgi:hypothetical protein
MRFHRGIAIPLAVLALSLLAGVQRAAAQAPGARRLEPNLTDNIARPLRYRPENGDFVIVNGPEFFNRPLYGGNTAFRVDAGDKPEFSLYLPGRGGNLRFGLQASGKAKWLHEAAGVVARYRPGEMLYEIRDPLLGPGGVLRLAAVALDQTDGLIVRVEARGVPAGIELVWAYGGVNGQRGSRDGDIGTERVPISEYFQLQPEFCRDNRFTIESRRFTLHSRPATIVGLVPEGSHLAVADAAHWSSCAELLATADPSAERPILTGRVALADGTPLLFALQRVTDRGVAAAADLDTYRAVTAARAGGDDGPAAYRLPPAYGVEDLPAVSAEAEAHFAALRGRVTVDTPDPYLNAAVGALNVAADAVWDGPQDLIMHGAIAWRTPLLGWRGPYALDTLGWHDRARRYLTYWAARQNTDPIPAQLPPPDENANLARSEAALHSNGDLSNSHYDMNLVYIDVLFRHLLWTGDLDLARQLWPVIERHLAWERRLFRREFGPDKLPLYEAYADIWASDDLQYNGGGVAYASAYNYYHNLMAARLARMLGHDPAPFEREAELIARAMREYLWLPDQGMFAEAKDLLGLQLVHPSAGLWSFYHTMDSGLPTAGEAFRMTMYVDRRMPHLPVRGPGVPADDDYHVLSTTDWMPYTWSVNNVVLAENVHTALGFWQAGRPTEAWRLLKSALLASMYMGICPGDVGTMDYLDVYRREAQRDFADGGGVLARAVIEGLFGVQPDLLAGELRVTPGFPASWDHASLRHPDVSVAWRREGDTDRYLIESRFGRPLELRLDLPAWRETATATIDGQPAEGRWRGSPVQGARFEVRGPIQAKAEIVVTWKGAALRDGIPIACDVGAQSCCARPAKSKNMRAQQDCAPTSGEIPGIATDWHTPLPTSTRFETVDLNPHFNDRVTNIFKHEYRSPRSPSCSLAIPKQGLGGWAGEVHATADIDDTGLRAEAGAHGGRLLLPNGVPLATPGLGDARNVLFTSQWDNFPREATVPLHGRARHVYLLMAGSTNWMQSRLDNGEVIVTYADGTAARLELHNPTNWWPIEQDYFVDDYQFARPEPIPPRVDLKTGLVRLPELPAFEGQGRRIPGGAATVLELPLNPQKELKSLTVRSLANEAVIGLMAATLER